MPTSPQQQTIDFIHLAARYLEAVRAHEETREELFKQLPTLLPGARQQANGLSQADLAQDIGLHETAISKIENGRQLPNLANLAKMVLVFAEHGLGIPGPRAAQYSESLLEAVYLFKSEFGESIDLSGRSMDGD